MSVEHYENFPVASWLCPASLRPAVKAIYWFARTADDIADEGDAPALQRMEQLAAYRAALDLAASDLPDPLSRWPQVFEPLREAMRRYPLPPALLRDLLSAFEQDVANPPYRNRAELLNYCGRSANPVGRILLGLYGVGGPDAARESDAVCSALQLINFWQDLSRDLPRGRCYVPESDLHTHGLSRSALPALGDTPATRLLIAQLCQWSEQLMLEGAPLVHRLPGRAGWELRLVVQGGLRVLEKIRRMDHATLSRRPVLNTADAIPLLLRAATMRHRKVAA